MGSNFSLARLQRAVLCLGILSMPMATVCAQEALPIPEPSKPLLGGPRDWSNQHIIYTRNGSTEDVLGLRDDPRFVHSILLHALRESRQKTGEGTTAGWSANIFSQNSQNDNQNGSGESNRSFPQPNPNPNPFSPPSFHPGLPARSKRSKVDWSISLGPTAGLAIGETPAVYTYNYSTPSCSNLTAVPPTVGDFAVYTINATPTIPSSTVAPGQANLIGLTNLYSAGAGNGFCTGTGPSFLFAYAIGSGGSALSPVLSLNGSKIAWIENRTTTTSYLHVTTWVANDGISATFPTAPTGIFSNGSCVPSTSSCDFALNYTASTYTGCSTAFSAGNGHSDLYVDYPSNTGFISANNGLLYHIKNIFSTTVTPSIDFCVPVNTTFETVPSSAMSGPVYDRLLNKVFIADSEKIYSYTVNASGSTPAFLPASPASYTYGNALSLYNYPTAPGPLLDMFNGYLYLFSSYDAAAKTSVTQVPVALGSGVVVPLGPLTTGSKQVLFYGAFDNNYFNNGPASALSTLYSCGTDSTNTAAQDLFAISFNASTGLANTTPAMSSNKNINSGGTTTGLCSPLTEFYDGSNDRLFVGMGQPGAATGTNVVTMWNINSQLTNTSGVGGTMPTYTAQATGYLGGTSGLAADNNVSLTAQSENVYFSTETVGTAATLVPATTAYNVNGIYTSGTHFSNTGGLDNDGNAYASSQLGTSKSWNGTTFTFGPSNAVDVWANTTITLPSGQYNTLEILAAAVNADQKGQTLTLTYTDNSTVSFTQSYSDWFTGTSLYSGESVAVAMTFENTWNGSTRVNPTFVYGYSYAIDPNKTVKSLTLPANRNVVVLAVALASNCGGADYCAVKLTQTGLQ
jgi:hypothetical protein